MTPKLLFFFLAKNGSNFCSKDKADFHHPSTYPDEVVAVSHSRTLLAAASQQTIHIWHRQGPLSIVPAVLQSLANRNAI